MDKLDQYLLIESEAPSPGLASRAAAKFGVSRQAAHLRINKLVDAGMLKGQGATRNRTYRLVFRPLEELSVPIGSESPEDVIWRDKLAAHFRHLPQNIQSIWHYGFTEMFNNAIDHSGGHSIFVGVGRQGLKTSVVLRDDGEGIFRKIRRELQLPDERTAILELAKGKLTTDPKHHSGEGIFFTSRAFDAFYISSGGLFFSHQDERASDLLSDLTREEEGTTVWMDQNDFGTRQLHSVFDEHAAGADDYRFSKTVVALRLAQHEGENLVSRSQAKRLVSRFERFREVVLDFAGISEVGQAFADEVFRVFALEHRQTSLVPINMNENVTRMVRRAQVQTMMSDIGIAEESPLQNRLPFE